MSSYIDALVEAGIWAAEAQAISYSRYDRTALISAGCSIAQAEVISQNGNPSQLVSVGFSPVQAVIIYD
jgi:hypothetical protein